MSPIFRSPNSVLCWFLSYLAKFSELLSAQASCFSRYAHHGLDLFAPILTLLTLQLDFGRSAQCSTVDLCLCLLQLLDKGSMVTFEIVNNQIRGKDKF